MGKAPASQFYWGDLRRDVEYHLMSFEARGVWVEMLTCMWDARERGKIEGTLEQLSILIGCPLDKLTNAVREINVTKTGDVTNGNEIVTIINRRMFREEKSRISTRLRVKHHRDEKEKRDSNANVTLASSSSSSSSSSSIKKENNKRKKSICDEEWVKSLQEKTCYSHLNVIDQLQRCIAWFDAKGITVSRQRFLNWLNNPKFNSKPLSVIQRQESSEKDEPVPGWIKEAVSKGWKG